MTFFCSVCHYDATDPASFNEEQLAERQHLTVVDGQLVCMAHIDVVSERGHAATIAYGRQIGLLG